MAEVSVVMLGGRRVGKSSILAGMIEAINHSKLSEHFVIKDKTDYSNYGQLSIERKRSLLVNMPSRVPSDADFMTQTMADSKVQCYTITFRLPFKPGALTVDFYDVPGEYANPNRLEFESEILPLIQSCDVFIIAVDSPHLMLSKNSVNDTVNRIQDLHCALQNIIIKSNKDLKLVMFCPVKCEKWAKENRLNELNERLKSKYRVLIDSLSYEGVGISIIPIQTVGNIIFDDFHPAHIICKQGETDTFPCHVLENGLVRVSNGREFELRPPYSVKDDPHAIIDGIAIPNSWFRVTSDKRYAPVNCEQPALHILKFLVDKTSLSDKEAEANDSFLSKCTSFFGNFANWWNGVDFESFRNILDKMEDDGTLRISTSGIEIIRPYTRKEEAV